MFIFCVRVLLRRSRWHQVVALCRRFGLLGRGPPFHCAVALGLLAQQKVIYSKKLALQKLREQISSALQAQKAAEEKLSDIKATTTEREQAETYACALPISEVCNALLAQVEAHFVFIP